MYAVPAFDVGEGNAGHEQARVVPIIAFRPEVLDDFPQMEVIPKAVMTVSGH